MYLLECYSATNRKTIHATTCMDLESITLSEGSQTYTAHQLLASIYTKPKNRNRYTCRIQVDDNLELGIQTEHWLLMHCWFLFGTTNMSYN